MNTEDYENRGFPIRNFLIKLILIIIFVFLLVWLLPKFIVPAINKNINWDSKYTEQLDALTSQIFADNLEKMKQAAISYYTDERLPQNVGDSKTMTLSDMIGLKIITPLVDKNNKAVDVEKSYVKITKTEDEYILKVNIKDSEKEDYILVHLGCYNYCDSYICEKKQTDVIIKGDKTPTTPVVEKHYCKIVNGKYYGKNGNVVDKTTYENECVTKRYCEIVNGTYYGKTGNVVDKETYENECTTKPPEVKYYCEIVDGKYYDKNGNVVSKEDYEKSCKEPEKEYIYEYAKTTGAAFSEWTKWSSWGKVSCDTKEINCSDKDITCLKKLQRLNRKEKIGTYEKEYVKTRKVQVQTATYEQKSCANYNYVIINKTTYAVSTASYVGGSSMAGWSLVGTGVYANPPVSTAGHTYVFRGADFGYCSDTCQTLPDFYYDEYQYDGSMSEVSSTTSTTVEATCGEIVTKQIPVFSTITVSDVATRTEPLYGTVCYASTKTRTITSQGETKKTWSKYNDTSLLNDGWYYTGNKKEVTK